MKFTTSSGTYEQYDLTKLNDKDLEKFWRIIQDTWSFYFKEYLSCDTCDTVFSKKDIFKPQDKNYRNYTIEELEAQFGIPKKCSCNEGILSHLWGDSYLPSLEKSLTDNIHTTLVTFKNAAHEIVGLTYSNVDPLYKIYDHDLSFDFSAKDFAGIHLYNRSHENFLLTTGLSIIERETNTKIACKLLAYLHKCIPIEYQNIPGVIATIYRTQVYKLYQDLGAEDFNLTSITKQNVRLMYCEKIACEFNKKFSFILE